MVGHENLRIQLKPFALCSPSVNTFAYSKPQKISSLKLSEEKFLFLTSSQKNFIVFKKTSPW